MTLGISTLDVFLCSLLCLLILKWNEKKKCSKSVCVCVYVQLCTLPPTLTFTRLTIGIYDVTNGQEFSQRKVYMHMSMAVYLEERRKKKKSDQYKRKEGRKNSNSTKELKLNLQLPGQQEVKRVQLCCYSLYRYIYRYRYSFLSPLAHLTHQWAARKKVVWS